jgi:hypothetical protein
MNRKGGGNEGKPGRPARENGRVIAHVNDLLV